MFHDDLLIRMMHRDVNAFMEMSEKYSWSVYSVIRARISDKNKVESVFNETMNGFYNGLHNSGCEDPMEALLQMYAEKVCQISFSEPVNDVKLEHPVYRISEPAASQPKKKKGSFLYSICVFFLVLAIIAVIWVILGLLMDMNLIPGYDLGYNWFNSNVLPWF